MIERGADPAGRPADGGPGPGIEDREARARRYARLRRSVFFLDLLLGATALLLLLVFGGAVAWQMTLASRIDGVASLWPGPARDALLLVAYVASLSVGATVLSLPLGYYGGFVLPHRFGLSVQTRRGWVTDVVKGGALGTLQTLIVAGTITALVRVSPEGWWLWSGLALAVFGVLLANLAPLLIVPLFFTLRPLPQGELRERLEGLAAGAGARVRGVYVMDLSRRTRAANAALMGIGNTRRIVLGDTLLATFSPREVTAVLAHELGHHVHGDLWRGIALDGALTLLALWVAERLARFLAPPLGIGGLGEVAALPLLLAVGGAVSLAALPITNGYSRRREAAADAFAVRATADPEAWKGALRRLAHTNLSETDPPRWVEWLLYSHPSIRHRLEAADVPPGGAAGGPHRPDGP